MAFNSNPIVSGLPAYVDESKEALIAKAVLGSKTVGLFNKVLNVKGDTALHLLDTTVAFQDGSVCGWTPEGTNQITQRLLKPKYLKVNMEWCDKNFLDKYTAHMVQIAAGTKTLPYEQEFTDDIVKGINEKMEKLVWQGSSSSAVTGEFAGILEILNAESGSTVNVTAATGTSAYQFVKDVYMGIPEEVINDSVIFVSDAVFRELIQDMVTANLYHYSANNDHEEFYLPGTSTRVIRVSGLNGTANYDYAIAGQLKNFVYGTDLVGDENKIEFWYSQDNRTFRLAVEWVAGTQVAFPDEIVVGKRAK